MSQRCRICRLLRVASHSSKKNKPKQNKTRGFWACFSFFAAASFAPSVTWASSVRTEHKRPERQHSRERESSLLTSPSSSSHRSSFPPFRSKDKKKNQTNKKTQHFSHASLSLHLHLITASPSRPLQPCSVFFFLFFPADLFFVVVFCPLVSSTVCHVSATKQRNQSVSCRAEGREGVRIGGGFLLLRRTEEPIYLFKCAAPQERFPVPPLLRLQNVDQCDCRAPSHPRKNGGE